MRRAVKILSLAGAALAAQACATAPTVMNYFPDGAEPEIAIVWPEAPAEPRLSFDGLLVGDPNFSRPPGETEGAGVRFLRWIAGIGGGRAARLLVRPQTGVVDDAGRILVSDAGLQAIVVFDEAAGSLEFWTSATDGRDFLSPVGIAVAANGRIYVADADLGSVIELDSSGEPRGELGVGLLERPTGMAIDPLSGEIFVADTRAHDIKVFSNDGSLARTIGRGGTGPGEFNAPSHLSLVDGRLYVSDTFNARIQVLDMDGAPQAEIGRQGLFVGNLVRPKGVTADSDGNVYVIESYYDHLLVFDEAGNLLLPIGGTGTGTGQFFLPAGIWSDAEDRIFIADMFNGRVIMLRYLGS